MCPCVPCVVCCVCTGFVRDNDKKVRIKAVVSGFTMTCDQCAGIARLCQAFIAESIILMYPALTDKQNLQTVVFKELKFKEDKDEVLKKCGLA